MCELLCPHEVLRNAGEEPACLHQPVVISIVAIDKQHFDVGNGSPTLSAIHAEEVPEVPL